MNNQTSAPSVPSSAYPTLKAAMGGEKADSSSSPLYIWGLINSFYAHVQKGILFVLPLVLLYLNVKYFCIFVYCLVISAFVGMFVGEFDSWNSRRYYNRGLFDRELPLRDDSKPKTELEVTIERFKHFKNKYYFDVEQVLMYLENDIVPIGNNLDWIEVVSLVNQLSLHLGKQFAKEKKKEGK